MIEMDAATQARAYRESVHARAMHIDDHVLPILDANPSRDEIPELISDLFSSCYGAPKEYISQAIDIASSILASSYRYPGPRATEFLEKLNTATVAYLDLFEKHLNTHSMHHQIPKILSLLYDQDLSDVMDPFVERNMDVIVKHSFRNRSNFTKLLSQYVSSDINRLYEVLARDSHIHYTDKTWEPNFEDFREHLPKNYHWEATRAFASHTLYKYGLYSEFFSLWYHGNDIEEIEENLSTLIALMNTDPKIAPWLIRQRGIKRLGRYHTSDLVNMYKERDMKASDCTIVVASSVDDPRIQQIAITDYINALNDQIEELRSRGWSIKVELFEFDDIQTLRKRIRKISSHSKQTIIIYDDHGNKDTFNTSAWNPVRLDQAHTLNPYASKASATTQKNIICVLNSCSTGQKRGFAERLSSTGISVFAPDRPCTIDDIELHHGQNGFTPIIRFSHHAKTVHFRSGREISKWKNESLAQSGIVYIREQDDRTQHL